MRIFQWIFKILFSTLKTKQKFNLKMYVSCFFLASSEEKEKKYKEERILKKYTLRHLNP